MGWWDGYRWFQLPAVPQYVEPYERVRSIARVAQALLGLIVALKVVSLVLDGVIYAQADDLGLRDQTLDDLFAGPVGASLAVATLTSLVTLGAAIAFLMWRHRIQRNLRGALGVAGLEYTPGWTVGWWFVPIANLWKPKQVMDEAWRASDPSSAAGSRGWAGRSTNPTIGWWWAMWIVSFLVTINVQVGGSGQSITTGAWRFRLGQEMVGLGLSAFAAYLGIQMVGQITARHRQRARVFGIDDT
jgi:hypothetical protein